MSATYPMHGRQRRAQLVAHVGEELVLHAARLQHGDVLPLQLRVALDQRRVRAPQLVDQIGLLGRRRELVGDDAQQPALVVRETALVGEVERDGAEHARRRAARAVGRERQRDERAEAQLARDLLPVAQRRIGEDVRHLDHAALGRRLATRTLAQPHARVAHPLHEAVGPVVRGGQAHRVAIPSRMYTHANDAPSSGTTRSRANWKSSSSRSAVWNARAISRTAASSRSASCAVAAASSATLAIVRSTADGRSKYES